MRGVKLAGMTALMSMMVMLTAAARAEATGYVHAEGRNLVDPAGHRLLLRGTNLGNWLIQEGYMFHFDGGPQSAREIEALTTELM